jgi:hypothetical protein
MAILKLGGLVTKISGKVGGQILGTGTNGSYIKNNAYSQQRNTVRQSAQRTYIGQITQFWRTLTISQKDDWQDEVSNYPYENRVGDIVEYTGYQLYCFLNLNRQVIGLSRNDNVPTFVAVANPTYNISSLTTIGVIIGYIGGVLGTTVLVYGTRSMPTTNKPKDKDYLLVMSNDLLGGNATFPITTEYIALFGAPVLGEYVSFKFRTVVKASGNSTNFTDAITTVVS